MLVGTKVPTRHAGAWSGDLRACGLASVTAGVAGTVAEVVRSGS